VGDSKNDSRKKKITNLTKSGMIAKSKRQGREIRDFGKTKIIMWGSPKLYAHNQNETKIFLSTSW